MTNRQGRRARHRRHKRKGTERSRRRLILRDLGFPEAVHGSYAIWTQHGMNGRSAWWMEHRTMTGGVTVTIGQSNP